MLEKPTLQEVLPERLTSEQGDKEWNSAFQCWGTPRATPTSDMGDTILAFSPAGVDSGHLWLRDLYGLGWGESSELKLELKQGMSPGFIRGQTSGLGLTGAQEDVSRRVGEVGCLCAWHSASLLVPIFSCWEGGVRTILLSWARPLFRGRWECGIFFNW